MTEQPAPNRMTLDTPVTMEVHTTLHDQPVEPSGLTVEDIRRWAEHRRAEADDWIGRYYRDYDGGSLMINELMRILENRRIYRELAEALAEGRLPK